MKINNNDFNYIFGIYLIVFMKYEIKYLNIIFKLNINR